MPFTVPKFIEREARIVGPLTLKQFAFLAISGAICLYSYFKTPFFIFLLSLIFIGGGGIALAFVKIGGIPLSTILVNFFKFRFSQKKFIWKKEGAPAISERIEIRNGKLNLPLTKNGQIKKIKLKVETKK